MATLTHIPTRRCGEWAVGALVLALGGVAVSAPAGASAAFPGRNGRISYLDGITSNVLSVRPGGGGDRLLARAPAGSSASAYKPDGRMIVFDAPAAAGDGGALFLKRANGRGRARRLTRPFDPKGHAGTDTEANWSPDGQSVVFVRSYERTLGTGPCAGANNCIRIYHRGSSQALIPDGEQPVWSTRGFIALVWNEGIWVLRPNGSSMRRLVRGSRLDCGDWSPDGRRLIFVDGRGRLATVGADGRHLRHLHRRGLDPAYSPDGNRVVYSDDATALWTINLKGGDRRLVRTPPGGAYAPDWQPLPRRRHR